MRTNTVTLVKVLGVLVAVALAISVGYIASGIQAGTIGNRGQGVTSSIGAGASDAFTGKSAGVSVGTPTPNGTVGAAPESPAAGSVGITSSDPSATDRLVVSTAAMSLHVGNVEKSVATLRDLAAKYGAVIADLTLNAGDSPVAGPTPLDVGAGAASLPSPASARITLRVPAAKLGRIQSDAAALGAVLSQSASESDVTQQHVDLVARLKNLVAEEVRLRSFLNRATKVPEMLDVERELSRVRGEIESLQAQVTYLEHQVALATLTIDMSESGPVIRPATGGWGFVEAVTSGLQAAAALIRLFISGVIALSPLIALALLIRILWVFTRRRRTIQRFASPGTADARTSSEKIDENDAPSAK